MQGPKLHKLKSRNSSSSAAVCTEPLGACINCSHRADTSAWHMLTFTRHFLHRYIMSKAKMPVIHSLLINEIAVFWEVGTNCMLLVFIFYPTSSASPVLYCVHCLCFLDYCRRWDEHDSGGANFGQSWICVSSALHIFCKLRKSDLLPVCFFY